MFGAVPGRSRFLSACSGGCIGFVEVWMSQCYWEMQLQFARRLIMLGWYWVADGGGALSLRNAIADC